MDYSLLLCIGTTCPVRHLNIAETHSLKYCFTEVNQRRWASNNHKYDKLSCIHSLWVDMCWNKSLSLPSFIQLTIFVSIPWCLFLCSLPCFLAVSRYNWLIHVNRLSSLSSVYPLNLCSVKGPLDLSLDLCMCVCVCVCVCVWCVCVQLCMTWMPRQERAGRIDLSNDE